MRNDVVAMEMGALHGFYGALRRTGAAVTTELLTCDTATVSGELARALAVPGGTPVRRLERLYRVNQRPLALTSSYLWTNLAVTFDPASSTTVYRLLAAHRAAEADGDGQSQTTQVGQLEACDTQSAGQIYCHDVLERSERRGGASPQAGRAYPSPVGGRRLQKAAAYSAASVNADSKAFKSLCTSVGLNSKASPHPGNCSANRTRASLWDKVGVIVLPQLLEQFGGRDGCRPPTVAKTLRPLLAEGHILQ